MFFGDWQTKEKCEVTESLLWEYDLKNFDWFAMRTIVVQRVIERGWVNDYYAILQLYGGFDTIREIIKEIPQLSDKDTAFVCAIFGLKKEELKCYLKKQSEEIHLNS